MTTTAPTETDEASQQGFDVTVHLKGGTAFTIRVAEWTVSRNRLTQDLQAISWEHIAGHPRLRYLDIGSIAAVLVADAPAEQEVPAP